MRGFLRTATVLVVIALSASVPVTAQDITNPTNSTYDPTSGHFFGPDGEQLPGPPPVPPYLANRGWSQNPTTGQLIDPKGNIVEPETFYPSPERNPNPYGTTYDPGTKTFYTGGRARPYAVLPPYLDARGFRSDSTTGEIVDPDGNLVDPTTLYPAPERDSGLRYDPSTGKYYTADGNESPPSISQEMKARGWTLGLNGQWVSPTGALVPPEDVFDPPSNPNPNDYSYDPVTGKYFDRDGKLVVGSLPDYLQHRGWTLDPNTGEITNPNGSKVDPSTMFPEPAANPHGVTYDPTTKSFPSSGRVPDLPDYLRERGWRLDQTTFELIDPQGRSHDPSTYYPAPSDDTGLLYDPSTNRFYTTGGIETPPTLPSHMEAAGWIWDSRRKKFIDPSGALVDPGILAPNPFPNGLPAGRPPAPTTPPPPPAPNPPATPTPPAIPDRTPTEIPGDLSRLDLDFFYGSPASNAASFASPPATMTHVVAAGDNLFRIALRYGTTVDALMAANDLRNAALIFPGQQLAIPTSSDFAVPGDSPLDVTALNTGAASTGARETRVQLEIVFMRRTRVGGNAARGALPDSARPVRIPDVASMFTPIRPRAEGAVRLLTVAAGAGGEPVLRAAPSPMPPAAEPPQPAGPPAVTALFTSLGVSTGDAFEVELVGDGAAPLDLGATGVVLEPLEKQAQDKAREAFARAARGRRTIKATATGYCLELALDPPPAGMVFRVAPRELQEQFTPMRDIWRSAKQLFDAGGLSPDSDPTQYFHSIVQWSVWSEENGFDVKSFGEAFLARTKKNFSAAGQPWTDQVEQAVRQITPNRWNDIQRIVSESERLRAAVTN